MAEDNESESEDFIVVIRYPTGKLVALMADEDQIAVFKNEAQAEDAASHNLLCRNYDYDVVPIYV